MLNPETGEMTFHMLGREVKWRINSREAAWLETMASMKSDTKVDFLTHVFAIQNWTFEDFELAIVAGLRGYDKSAKVEDVEMTVTEMAMFKLLFAEWVSTLIPDYLKKKLEEIQEKVLRETEKQSLKTGKTVSH